MRVEHYRWLADAVLIVHVLIVLFVVSGLILTLVGGWRHWDWVRKPGFRLAHLATIGVSVAQAWGGVACQLTTWEDALRVAAGDAVYGTDFIAFWLRALLFYEAPPRAFTVAYTVFGALVALTWWFYPPRHRPRGIARAGAGPESSARDSR